jgi:hypothetical protein
MQTLATKEKLPYGTTNYYIETLHKGLNKKEYQEFFKDLRENFHSFTWSSGLGDRTMFLTGIMKNAGKTRVCCCLLLYY